jgi:hypothetical protein
MATQVWTTRAYSRVEGCAFRRKRLANKYRPLRESKAASHSPIALRVCSAAPSLRSMVRLNIARSRWRPFRCRQTRIVQTSFGFNRTLLPIRRPLFQGVRCRGGMGFSVVMVDAGGAGPVYLSAGSTSTGSNNLPWIGPIAPKVDLRRRSWCDSRAGSRRLSVSLGQEWTALTASPSSANTVEYEPCPASVSGCWFTWPIQTSLILSYIIDIDHCDRLERGNTGADVRLPSVNRRLASSVGHAVAPRGLCRESVRPLQRRAKFAPLSC